MSTHGWRMPMGRHKGERITRVPVSYLRWMVNAGAQHADKAREELGRRGTVLPTLEISHHAIDRASMLVLRKWQHRDNRSEGLHAWLHRLANEVLEHAAVAHVPTTDGTKLEHPDGVVFVFTFGECWPTVKTVMPSRRVPPRPTDEVLTHDAIYVPGEIHLGSIEECPKCQ